MAKSSVGDVVYYGAIGGVTYLTYKLGLEGTFGASFQKAMLDVQNALHAGQRAGAGAVTGAIGGGGGGQTQLPSTTLPAGVSADANGVVDLGQVGLGGLAWGMGDKNGWWVVAIDVARTNPAAARIRQAYSFDQAVAAGRSYFG